MAGKRGVCIPVLVLIAALCGCGQSDRGAPASPSPEQSESAPSDAGAEADPNAVRYLALGDSLTQGVGAPDEQTGSFPALLAQRWRDAGCDVDLRNVGVSGYTAGQVVSEQLPEVEAFDPTVITFQAAANDIVNGVTVDEYRGNVATVLDQATASGARVIVLGQNEWFRSPEGQNYGPDLEAQRAAFDAVLIEETSARGAEFIDLGPLYTQQADDGQWVEDGIHPTQEAYDAWSAELANAVPAPCE